MKAQPVADLYSDYLLASFGATTATGLSQRLEGEVSQDQVTRDLAGTKKTASDVWRTVKPFVREVQSEAGVLIIDDSIEEKPYTDENDIGCWHYDHSKDRLRKGIHFLTALYSSQGVRVPVGCHLVAKTEKDTDPKTRKEERLALLHLAEGNLVNPRNVEVIERLMQRGLIRRDPDFQLANRSFARFVLTAESRERITEWEQETPESVWAVLRLPLVIALLLVGAFVTATGGEAFDATAAVIPAALAGLPVLIQVLNLFRGGKSASSDEK